PAGDRLARRDGRGLHRLRFPHPLPALRSLQEGGLQRPPLQRRRAAWAARAGTSVDNHDTEHRRDREQQHSCAPATHFEGWMMHMAYAYVLTHPGIPCVFWSHFLEWGDALRWKITQLMTLRK